MTNIFFMENNKKLQIEVRNIMEKQLLSKKVLTRRYFDTRKLVYSSIFIGLSVVFTRFLGLILPIAGLPALRFNFGTIPLVITGILFGPMAGALAGALADLIGYMLNPAGGVFFPGFTLSFALSGAIPGLVYMFIRSKRFKSNLNFNYINTIICIILAAGVPKGLFYKGVLTFKNGKLFYLDNQLSTIYILIYTILVIGYIAVPIIMTRKTSEQNSLYSIDKILFIVSLSYLIISIGLNTYWLSLLFNKGYIMFLPTRIVFGFIKIPINTLILFSLTKLFKYIGFT